MAAAADRGLVIRRADSRDAPEIGRIHALAWQQTYRGLLPDDLLASMTAATRETVWRRVLAGPENAPGDIAVCLAEQDGWPIGFASCCRQRSAELEARGFAGEVAAIYVLRDFQGRGAGTRLLGAMAGVLAGQGFSAASLWVLQANMPARRFYERCGAAVIAQRTETRPGAVLHELAYGWTELAPLLRQPA